MIHSKHSILALLLVLLPVSFAAAFDPGLFSAGTRLNLGSLRTGNPAASQICPDCTHVFLQNNAGGVYSIKLTQPAQSLQVAVYQSDGNAILKTHCGENVLCRGELLFSVGNATSFVVVVTSLPVEKPVAYELLLKKESDSGSVQQSLAAFGKFYEAEDAFAQKEDSSIASAAALYQEALAARQSMKDRMGEAEALLRLGDCLAIQSKNQEAIESYSNAAQIYHEAGDLRSEAFAEIRIGESQTRLADALSALDHLGTALAYFSGSGYEPGEALALLDLGAVYFNMGDVDQALQNYRRSLSLWTPLGERRLKAITLMSAAAAHAELKENETAIDLYRQALPVLRQIGDQNTEAATLTSMGLMYNEIGDFQKALDSCFEALSLRREFSDIRGQAETLNSLGVIYHGAGDLDRAFSLYQQALPLRKAAQDTAGEAETLNNIGRYYLERGESSRALESYLQSYALIRRTGYRSREADALRNIAQAEIALGQIDVARKDLEKASEIFVSLGDRSGEASCILGNASIQRSAGDSAAALDLFGQALTILRQIGDRPGEAQTLLETARIQKSLRKWKEASANAEESIRILESIRSEFLSHALRVTYLSAGRDAYEFYVDLLYEMSLARKDSESEAVAFRISEGARARSLSDLLSEHAHLPRSGADSGLLLEERALRRQLSARQQERFELMNRKHEPEEAALIDEDLQSLGLRLEQLESTIRRQTIEEETPAPPSPARLSDVQQRLLDPNTVLIEFLTGKDRTFAWAVSQSQCVMYPLPAERLIEPRVLALFRILQEESAWDEAKFWKLSDELYQLLIGPASAMIRNRRILISADGVLQYLPFAVLRARGTAHPLGIDHPIVYLPSATSVLLLREEARLRKPPDGLIAVLADPVFDPGDPRIQQPSGVQRWTRSPQSLSLSRIPFTRREAQAIVQLAPKPETFVATDCDASRETLESDRIANYRFVHIATHGILDAAHPEFSGLVLSLYDRDGSARPGLITSSEIFNLKLNADLVVLSGCSTALGKEVRGEGLLGLARAFMYAGAQRVVASLWSVQDAATVDFMTHFYQGVLKRNLTPAAALQETQKYSWNQNRNGSPSSWAAFVLLGEFN